MRIQWKNYHLMISFNGKKNFRAGAENGVLCVHVHVWNNTQTRDRFNGKPALKERKTGIEKFGRRPTMVGE